MASAHSKGRLSHTSSAGFLIPPHIPPLDKAVGNISALRKTLKCAIGIWTDEVYTEDFHRPGIRRLLYVMKPEAVRKILVDQAGSFPLSRSTINLLRPIWRTGLAASEGADWRRQRQAMASFFTPKAVQSAIPLAEQAAHFLVSKWQATSGPTDLTSDISYAMSTVMWQATLGVGPDDPHFIAHAEASRKLLDDMQPLNAADILQLPLWTRRLCGPTNDRSAKELHKVVQDHLAANPTAPKYTLRDQLKDANAAKRSSPSGASEIFDNLVGMLAAGRETTALAASWTLWLIANCKTTGRDVANEIADAALDGPLQPIDLEKLPLLKAAVMEAMRLFPPAYQILRRCSADTDLGGEMAKKGDVIIIPIYALHRREDSWHEPMAFNPQRFLPENHNPQFLRNRYLPFGAGPRICSGMHLALVEIQVLVATILRLSKARSDRNEATVTLDVGFVLRPANGLKVQFEWY